MSRKSKKLNKAEEGQVVDHTKYMKTYRHHVTRILRDIEAGSVDEVDMDKFRNFIQMSLALMETAPVSQIQAAWRHAEILSFTQPEPDTEIIRGETKMQHHVSTGITFPARK